MLYNSGCRYSALCSARSALTSCVILHEGISVQNTPTLVKRFLKGVFNKHQPQPKYCNIPYISILQ